MNSGEKKAQCRLILEHLWFDAFTAFSAFQQLPKNQNIYGHQGKSPKFVVLIPACCAFSHRSALCILLSVQSPSAPSSPSKKFLTQRRQYMESGYLGHEAAFVSYVAKLEDHKQKCKQAGRYPEAHAAAVRLHELRTAEAERRRNDMLERHQAELQEVEQAFESERSQLNSMWEVRIKHIEAAFEKQVPLSHQIGHTKMKLHTMYTLLLFLHAEIGRWNQAAHRLHSC